MFSKDVFIVSVIAVLLAGILIASSQWSASNNTFPDSAGRRDDGQVTVSDQPTLGSEDAPVTIVEFAEFYCPYCARYLWETFPEIDENYIKTGKVKYQFRNLVVHGEPAQLASIAGECANKQGSFWKFHDRTFEVIFKERKETLNKEDLVNIAEEIGLDVQNFQACMESDQLVEEISKDRQRLRELVEQLPEDEKEQAKRIGTPTFFINGHILIGAQPYEKFVEVIDQELEK